jgi:hypothetical protein
VQPGLVELATGFSYVTRTRAPQVMKAEVGDLRLRTGCGPAFVGRPRRDLLSDRVAEHVGVWG